MLFLGVNWLCELNFNASLYDENFREGDITEYADCIDA